MPAPRAKRPESLFALAVAATVVVVVLAVLGVRVLAAPGDRIPAGVSIGGIPVGGLTAAQAEREVSRRAAPPPREVEIAFPGEPGFPIRVPVAELAPDAARAAGGGARDAAALARRPLPQRDRHPRGDPRRPPPLPPRRRRPRPGGSPPSRRGWTGPPSPPRSLHRQATSRWRPRPTGAPLTRPSCAAAWRRLPRRVAVPVTPVPPPVGDAAAQAAYGRAAALANGPVAVRGAGRRAVISRPAAARRAALHARGRPDRRAPRPQRDRRRGGAGLRGRRAVAGLGVVRDLRVAGVGDAVERGAPHRRRGDRAAHRAAAGGGVGAGGAADDRARAQHRRRPADAHPRAGQQLLDPARLLRAARDQPAAGGVDPGRPDHPGRRDLLPEHGPGRADAGARLRLRAPDRRGRQAGGRGGRRRQPDGARRPTTRPSSRG